MSTPVRRRLRLARRGLGYTVAITLVLVATLLGAASQVLPLAERHPQRVAEWLSQRAGRPVAFDRVETAWTRRGPLLQLDNLRVGAGAQAFTIGDAEMLVSIYAGLLPGRAFSELRLRDLDLVLERAADGRWQVRGLPGQGQTGGDPLAALEGLGELQVIDGKLTISAPAIGIEAHIPRIDLRLRVDGDRVRAGARVWPGALAGRAAMPLDAVLDFDRQRGDGRVYAGARRAELAAWSGLLQLAGVAIERGHGRAEAWAELRGHRIAAVTVDAALAGLALRGAAAASGERPRAQFARVEARVHWRRVDESAGSGDWRLDAPRLRIGSDPQMQVLDGLLLAGGEHFAMRAQRIDAAPLLTIAALSDRLPPALRRWLQAAGPAATLHAVELTGTRGGPIQVSARFEAVGFRPVAGGPGLHGLAGRIHGDRDGFAVQFDPAAAVRVDWPRSFNVAHTARLRGTLNGWRERSGWRVGSEALQIAGDGFGAQLRGGLHWQGDGSRPRIDLAATVDETGLTRAKGFWPRHVMPAAVVEWLDAALVAGRVRDGRALIAGDLDHWPFADGEGRFEASARIVDATLQYQPGWPAAEQVALDARFVADGFSADGSGVIAGVGIARLHGAIDHYHDGTLTVHARGGGDAAQLLGLLRQSPLQPAHADTLASLSASGRARAGFDLQLPLRGGARPVITGEVVLDDAKLADRRWQFAVDRVNGRAEYSGNGFRADALRVRHAGQPGRLTVRAGADFVRVRGNAFEAGLDVPLTTTDLLERAPELAWLAPYLAGRSDWSVGVTVPAAGAGRPAPARLQLRSDLIGTALGLPAPLAKPAGRALAATIGASLPLGSGEIEVALGEVMGLRARSDQGRTGVRVALGSSRAALPPPSAGLAVSGRAEVLDALGWIGLTRGGDRPGGGLPLQRIDVTAASLQLLGGSFPAIRVVVTPDADGAIAVRADGAALQGALRVPLNPEHAVSGRFQRVHWRAASADPNDAAGAVPTPAPVAATTAAAAAGKASAPAASDVATLDPAGIPPLAFEIDELRVGDTLLGTAVLRARPTATGLHVDQLQTRSAEQAIALTGDWSGRGANARTRVAATLDSKDFGALLAGIGLGGGLAGGDGQLRVDAGWRGNPAEFALAEIDGRLTVAARDGRLLEVEPGAGRVLGLLSLAELPRRLTLDFRDFFAKGFAFNRLDGSVRFAAGTARSDDLLIDGPSAAISIRGAANLRTRRFDQTIEVRPKAGNLLTAVGALAGGPVGAAIGAAANAVLQKPLGQLGARTYKVTGPWADPKVEVLSREQGRLSAVQKPTAG